MSVTREDVLYVAALARLELTAAEIASFTNQLNGILEHVEDLQTAERRKIDCAQCRYSSGQVRLRFVRRWRFATFAEYAA